MPSIRSLSALSVADTDHAAGTVPLDADFDARWAAWVMRGHAHEQLVQRKLLVLAGSVVTALVLLYAFMHR